jgi:hypothetical protein
VDANAGSTAPEQVLRSEPDASRKAVSTRIAADRLKLSRFYVSEMVRQGKIPGYGVRHREGGRVRWYVYEDALPGESEGTQGSPARSTEQELLKCLLDAREHARLARVERDQAKQLLVETLSGVTAAFSAALKGNSSLATELFVSANQIRPDEERSLTSAQRHETEAEACLDAALRSLLPAAKSAESAKADNVSRAPSTAAIAPVTPDPENMIGNSSAI